MRIISGIYKGRRISVPGNLKARPTTDFAKEGLFNLLNNQIDFEDIDVLDLFAGTGSIGFEFISRACNEVVAVEQNEMQCRFIRKTAIDLGINNLHLLRTDVFKVIKQTGKQYDFIFADPPYELKSLAEIPDLVFNSKLLKEDGMLVLEHSSKNSFNLHTNFVMHRAYGNVNFSFFKQKTELND